jgi:hypothetical protein
MKNLVFKSRKSDQIHTFEINEDSNYDNKFMFSPPKDSIFAAQETRSSQSSNP